MNEEYGRKTVMTDSGLGSFGSESDTSPGPGVPSFGKSPGQTTTDAAKVIPQRQFMERNSMLIILVALKSTNVTFKHSIGKSYFSGLLPKSRENLLKRAFH